MAGLNRLAEHQATTRYWRFAIACSCIFGVVILALLVGVPTIGLDERDISSTDVEFTGPIDFATTMVFVAAMFLAPTMLGTALLFRRASAVRWPWVVLLGLTGLAAAFLMLGVLVDEGQASVYSTGVWCTAMVAVVFAGWRWLASDTWPRRRDGSGSHVPAPRLQDTIEHDSPTDDPTDPFPLILPEHRQH